MNASSSLLVRVWHWLRAVANEIIDALSEEEDPSHE